MGKTVTFYAKDRALVQRIGEYQKANNIPSFAMAVRLLCETALGKRVKTAKTTK